MSGYPKTVDATTSPEINPSCHIWR